MPRFDDIIQPNLAEGALDGADHWEFIRAAPQQEDMAFNGDADVGDVVINVSEMQRAVYETIARAQVEFQQQSEPIQYAVIVCLIMIAFCTFYYIFVALRSERRVRKAFGTKWE